MINDCPSCSNKISSQNRFCNFCGTKLRGFEEKIINSAISIEEDTLHDEAESKSWLELKDIIIFYGLFLVNSFVFYTVVSALGRNPIYTVYYWVMVSLFILYMFYKYPKNIRYMLSFRIPTPKELLIVLSLMALTGIFVELYFGIFDQFGLVKKEYSKNIDDFGWPMWSAYILSALLPGVLEEISFRGIIFNGLENILSQKEALIIQAALFSILHLSPLIFISHFVMGLLLGFVRIKTKNLYYGIIIHMMWNACVIT